MAGEDSKPAGMCYKLTGTNFTIGKMKFRCKILELKRSRIGIIVEFRGIPSGFPNQEQKRTSNYGGGRATTVPPPTASNNQLMQSMRSSRLATTAGAEDMWWMVVGRGTTTALTTMTKTTINKCSVAEAKDGKGW